MASLSDYQAILSCQNGRYAFYVPELGLHAEGPDAATAHAALTANASALFSELEKAGLSAHLPKPRKAEPPAGRDLARYAARLAIVAVTVVLTVLAGSVTVFGVARYNAQKFVIDAVENTPLQSGGKFWKSIESGLHNLAAPSNDIPEERRQQLVGDLRVVLDRYRPLISELAGGPPDCGGKPSK